MRTAAALALAAAVLSAAAARAAVVPDRFPLGVSAASGAVCEAVRDDDDPTAQVRGGRAWDVRCRGWDASLGHIYAYAWRGGDAVGPAGVWTRALAKRAACAAPKTMELKGLPPVQSAACERTDAKVAYTALWSARGGRAYAAEGFATLADVLQTGLGVAAGAERPPAVTERVAAAASADNGGGGLAAAAAAASASPENLRERGYSRNLAWRFTDAGTDFSALALNPEAPRAVRAEGYLNWALNTSNEGRFNRADGLFVEAKALIGQDAGLNALYASYQALHLRNQRRFEESIAAAETAKRMLASLTPGLAGGAAPTATAGGSGDIVIDAALASSLRSRSAFTLSELDPAARVKVQQAQLELTEATALDALGRPEQARAALERARVILSQPGLARVAVWLRVQVETELAREEQSAGKAGAGRARLALALQQIRVRQAGSSAEAYLTLELARADAVAGDQEAALRDFGAAVDLFRSARGAVGASADAVDVYFNLLLSRIASDPDHLADYANRFMAAAESLGSEATADTVARLSARLNQSSGSSAGLIRALEDTRRQLRLKEAEVSQSRAGGGTAAEVAARQAELKVLASQASELEAKVAAADPRYGQLVTTEVSLADLQKALRPGEIFVKTVLLDHVGYGIAVGRGLAVPYRIDTTRAELERMVVKLRSPFETEGRLPAYDVASSQAFFDAVFGAVREPIEAAKHIIYEPDPVTLGLPLGALATEKADAELIAKRRAAIRAKGEGVLSYDGVHWLGRTASSSLVVSAAAFVQSRNAPPSPAPRPLLGFGASLQPRRDDPRAFSTVVEHSDEPGAALQDEVCRATRTALLNLKPLGEAGQELRSVGASLGAGDGAEVTGEAFSDGALTHRRDLDQYRVLYFATHGLLPRPGGCLPEPSLLTSVDDAIPGSDGLLTVSDILGLKLDADLVVLSACDTGGTVTGDLDRSGLGGAAEALGGLTRAFIYAGARSLIVSHWQVDSSATVKLMTGMFSEHSPSLGEALRASQLRLMDSPDQYSHPYYWAAFTIVGDAARPMPAR